MTAVIDIRHEIEARRDIHQRKIERTEAICDEIKRVCGSDESLAALLLAVAMRVVGYPSTPDEMQADDERWQWMEAEGA